MSQTTSAEIPHFNNWLEPSAQAAGLWARIKPGPGFSFQLDGLPALDAMRVFGSREKRQTGRTVWTLTLGDSVQTLLITQQVTVYEDPQGVEITICLENRGQVLTGVITDWLALDLHLDAVPTLHGALGGTPEHYYPPRAFTRFERTPIPPSPWERPESCAVTLTTLAGRSSDQDMPFFLLDEPQIRAGLFVAVGWSSHWRSRLIRLGDSARLAIEVPGIRLRLPPGERVTGPTILVGPYAGDVDQGGNALRRFLWRHAVPDLGGQRPLPPVYYNSWFGLNVNITDERLRQQADAAAKIGCEYFHIDAGWYAGCGPSFVGYRDGRGNYEEVDRTKFPNGIGALADYVRSKGLRFGMWFEPEHAHKASRVALAHPEWMLPNKANPNSPFYLVNLGLWDAQDWVLGVFSKYIQEAGVEWIRWDMNAKPLEYYADSDETQGLTQLRYMEGLYRIYDELHRRYPHVFLEGCASGGRRIDLAIVKRTHCHFSSDHVENHHLVRYYVSGGNRFLPGIVMDVNVFQGGGGGLYPDIRYHCVFGATFGFSDVIGDYDERGLALAARHVQVFKSLRRYIVEDFYPLFPQPASLLAWDGWQFHDRARDEGFLLAFRLQGPEKCRRLYLRGLEPQAHYTLMDPYGVQATVQVSGQQLTTEGWPVTLERESTYLRTYRRLP